ncbi:serine/threonine protein kinase [Streptomyces sp. G1]|uniref:serine/threonine protein kinase n=1 Tax=Streptomyces sp. G1 TaxID=361572 RepID=UPI002548C04E|nr:serine/threonine protein kinase [Streptomyces sp. G1]
MSKPEHTESPEPSVGTGSPVPPAAPPTEPKSPAEPPTAGAAKRAAAAKPGAKPAAKPATTGAAKTAAAAVPPAAPEAAGAAEPEDAKPGAAAAEAEPRKPESPKSEPRKPELRKPAAPKAARGADPEDAKPVGAKAEPEPEDAKPAQAADAKPAGVGVEPEDAKPAAAVGAKPAVLGGEPEDAKPVLGKVGSEGGKPDEGVDAKSVRGKAAAEGVKAAEAADAKPVAVSKADEVAAAVKAAAAKAGEGAHDEGRLLAGRYRLGDVLGKGGMGTVWRAEDETLGRTVAVKELRFGSGVDEDEKRRLITRTLREAKAIARIRSGGAVTVYDVVDEDGRPWIVMELIEGPSLAEFIRESGPLTPRRAAEVGLAVLDVLRAAHRQGILHRDVKPSNVLLADRGNGRVVLTDFGIAQVEGDPSVTSTGMLVGAPSYISPERARGQRPGPPADMWSLGGLLYAAVEGVPPYDKGSALATLTAVMTEPVEPPKNAGPLTEVIYGLLVKDPAHRLDDDRARALLTAVIDAPEPPAPVAVPDAEETRQISLTEAREAAEKAAADKAAKVAEKAEKKERERREREQRERARAALKSARKAAAASAAAAAATATAATAAESPSPRPSPVAAPLTDVVPRRTIALAIAGVVMALAVIGSIVAYTFSGDDEKDGAPKDGKGGSKASAASSPAAGSSTPPPASPSPSPSPKTGEVPGGGAASPDPGQSGQLPGSGTNPGQGQGATPGGALPGLPPGYGQVNDPGFHFAMGLPEGFKQTGVIGKNDGVIYSRDGGFPRVQIDFNSSPKDDARAAWAELAPSVASSSSNYKLLRLEKVEYRGYPTVADWEFERDQKGSRVRVLDRGFRMDAKHGYAIMITCLADQWDAAECTQLRTTAFDTFQPLG